VVATLLRSSWPAGYGPLCAGLVLGEIAKAETPLSKVMVPLPKFAAAKPPDEDGANFVTRIVARGDKLVGRYGWSKHQAYLAQLPTGRLNHVFEVAGIEYPARPVPEAPGSAKSLRTRKLEVVEKPGAGELETAPKKKKEIILKKKNVNLGVATSLRLWRKFWQNLSRHPGNMFFWRSRVDLLAWMLL
jgi:hypothetical protein